MSAIEAILPVNASTFVPWSRIFPEGVTEDAKET